MNLKFRRKRLSLLIKIIWFILLLVIAVRLKIKFFAEWMKKSGSVSAA